ncbi:MAG: NlpC/P60 family protein [Actinomycetota bacterium]|nr:NlpC/P60 family protein [Actinomycetota bacterium]
MTSLAPTGVSFAPLTTIMSEMNSMSSIGQQLAQQISSQAPSFATLLSEASGTSAQAPAAVATPVTLAASSSPSSAPSFSNATPSNALAQAPIASTPIVSSGQSNGGANIVADAATYIGVPYQWGGSSPTTGFDCSGLVQKVFADQGISLPRTAAEQQSVGTPVASLSSAQPGDLVFYGSPASHVGIYIGNGKMIDAPEQGAVVRVDQVGTPTSIVRISPAPQTSSATLNSTLANEAGPYLPVFESAAAKNGINVNFLLAIAKVESNFNPSAVSSAGAQGMMQIMPTTAAANGISTSDPVSSIYGAAKLLSQKVNAFGSYDLAAAAYNAGDGAVQSYGGVPPYPETVNYVKAVNSAMNGGN